MIFKDSGFEDLPVFDEVGEEELGNDIEGDSLEVENIVGMILFLRLVV